MRASSDLASSL
jgi:hypothetical protein